MTKHDDIPWTTSTGRLYDDEGELVDDHAEYRLVPESQARALWEGAKTLIKLHGENDDLTCCRIDDKGWERKEKDIVDFENKIDQAIALLKKGIG